MLGLDVGGDFATLGLRVKSEGIQKAKAEVKGLGTQAKKTEKEFTGLSSRMDTLMTAAGLAAVGLGIAKIIQLGASVNETASKYRTVLGPAIGDANDFLGEFATVAGLSQTAGQDLVATSVAMAEAFGATKTEAIGFTEEVLRTSSDLASFNDVAGGTEEVFRALRASFTGEFEQLKKSNIVLREAAITQRALTNAQKERKEELTLMERAEATLQLAVEQAGVAMGDLERTQYSLANQTRQTAARLTDMRDNLASMAALGVETSGVMAELNDVLALLASDGSGTKAFFNEIGDIFGGFLQDVELSIIAFQTYGKMLGAIGDIGTVGFKGVAGALRGIQAEGEARIAEAQEEFRIRKETVEDEESLAEILEKQEEARIAARKLAEEEAALAAKALRDAEAAAEAAEQWKKQIEGVVIGLREVSDMGALSPFGVDRRTAFDRALGRRPDFERGVTAGSISDPGGTIEELMLASSAMGGLGEEAAGATFTLEDAAGAALGLANAAGALNNALGDVIRAIAGGGLTAGVGAIFAQGIGNFLNQGAEEKARREEIRQARVDFEKAMDDFVDGLTDRTRFEQLRIDALDNARELTALFEDAYADVFGTGGVGLPSTNNVQEFLDNLPAGQPWWTPEMLSKWNRITDSLRRDLERVEKQRLEEVAALEDGLAIRELVAAGLDDEAAAMRQRIKNEKEAAEAFALGGQALKDYTIAVQESEAAALAAAAAESKLAQNRDISEDFAVRGLKAFGGSDRDVLAAGVELDRGRGIRGLNELLEDGIIDPAQWQEFLDIINQEAVNALRDFDQAAREAAEAADLATAAEERRAAVDMENLEIRRLVALGLEDEVHAKRQQLELDDAIFAGRSDQYIALLLIVQAEEAAARERAKNAAATREQAQVLKESTKQIDGFSKALNGPAGLLLALRRSQAIIGAGSPNGLGLPTTAPQSVVINVSGAGSPEDVGKAIQRVLRRGGQNPTNRVG